MLQELENNEAILLMYLAGELPEADRVEVEQLLSTDGGLRASFESLKQLHGSIAGTLATADEAALPPATESARLVTAVRRTSRAMVKHRLEQRSGRAQADVPARSNWLARLPRWAYPVSAAAILLIAYVAYWGISTGGDSNGNSQFASTRQVGDDAPEAGVSLPTPPPTTSTNEPNLLTAAQVEQIEAAAEVLPATSQFPRAVDDYDRRLLVFSAGAYDVSTMFNLDADPTTAQPNP